MNPNALRNALSDQYKAALTSDRRECPEILEDLQSATYASLLLEIIAMRMER